MSYPGLHYTKFFLFIVVKSTEVLGRNPGFYLAIEIERYTNLNYRSLANMIEFPSSPNSRKRVLGLRAKIVST